jgi:hypothetical protein
MRSISWTTRRSRVALTVAAVAVWAAAGQAMAVEPLALLSGDQEVPPVETLASGRSDIVIGDDRSVSGGVDTSGVDGTAAHIHQGAAGTNGPVIVTLTKILATRWSVPRGTKLTEAQFESYKAGLLYVNVHSAAHKSGEIRVQLKPEPPSRSRLSGDGDANRGSR